jgi:hypothetical protein
VLGFGTPFFVAGVRMTTDVFRHRLTCLGWKILDDARQAEDGSWWLIAQSCGHSIVALADREHEVWSAACSMAFSLTCRGLLRP